MILKNVDKQEKNTAVFEVETDAAEFEKAVNETYLKNRSSISIPGFRKGKAPRAVIEGMYGREVFYQEAMDELAPAAYEFGLKESGLKVVGTPSVKDLNVSEERTVRKWKTSSTPPASATPACSISTTVPPRWATPPTSTSTAS